MPDGDNATLPAGFPPPPPTRPATEAPTLVPASPPPDTLMPLPVVPGYEIEGLLGRGGMGVVFRARQVGLNRVVALKMIPGGALSSTHDLARFLAEAEAVAAVRHANIVEIFDFGNYQGTPYFALEMCPGGSLAERLLQGPLSPVLAAGLVEALARAVQAAHDKHIIHRDLKPGNVLLAADGAPKITDFGLAKRLEVDRHLTHTGSVMGTPSYMAPEQARGKKDIGPGVDIWSLGAVLYECLAGRPPFKGATPIETLYQVTEIDAVAVRAFRPDVPRDLETITLKCLQKDPERRYASARELADDLRRFLDNQPIRARPVGAWERAWKWARRNPAPAAWGTVALVALLAAAAVSTWFGLEARHQAAQARQREGEARDALAQLERVTAAGLLRPLGTDRQKVELNDVELEALKELAALPPGRERLRVLFLDLALDAPQTRGQLEHRLEHAVHAAVGLNPTVRRLALERLRQKADATGDEEVKRLCRDIAALLAPREPGAVALEKIDDDPKEAARAERAEAARLSAAEAAALLDRARRAPARLGDAAWRDELRRACAAVAGRNDIANAAEATVELAVRVLDAAEKAGDEDEADLLRAWGHLAAPLRGPLTSRLAGRLFARVLRFTTTETRISFSDDEDLLAVLGARLGAAEAAQLASEVTALAMRSPKPDDLPWLARAYVALADHLPAERAWRELRVLARAIQNLPSRANAEARATHAVALGCLPDHLGADDARALARPLLAELRDPGVLALSARARAVTALAPHLPTGEAHAALRRVARAALDLVPTTEHPDAAARLAQAFAAVVPRLGAADLPPLARLIGQRASRLTDAQALWALAMMFTALEERLPAADHAAVAEVLAPAYFGARARRAPPESEAEARRDRAGHEAAVRALLRRLSTAQRVELLKHPACVEASRKLVLVSLTAMRGRPFAGLADLAAWLEKERPDIDLHAPPRLPLAVPAPRLADAEPPP